MINLEDKIETNLPLLFTTNKSFTWSILVDFLDKKLSYNQYETAKEIVSYYLYSGLKEASKDEVIMLIADPLIFPLLINENVFNNIKNMPIENVSNIFQNRIYNTLLS